MKTNRNVLGDGQILYFEGKKASVIDNLCASTLEIEFSLKTHSYFRHISLD